MAVAMAAWILGSLSRGEAREPYAPMPANWEGVYTIINAFLPEPDAALKEAEQREFQPLNADLTPVIAAHLQPWALAQMKQQNEYSAIDDLGAICGPAGIFRHPTSVAGYMLIQRPGEVLMASLELPQVGVRRIYLTGQHPTTLMPSWNGHSIGHWEGDTLIVDTVGFNDRSWLWTNMEPHTEALHVVERIRSLHDGQYLQIYTTVDDRRALTAPYSYSRYYRKSRQEFEQLALGCNADVGEQAEWNYYREQTIQQYEQSRKASP
jgi:hypothetical protein